MGVRGGGWWLLAGVCGGLIRGRVSACQGRWMVVISGGLWRVNKGENEWVSEEVDGGY